MLSKQPAMSGPGSSERSAEDDLISRRGAEARRKDNMPLDENKFPELIRELYKVVSKLETMFPGRPFTPDGHMVGSLAECFAEYYYDLSLLPCSTKGHDAEHQSGRVEIKATQASKVSLRSCPEHLLVFKLHRDGSFDEIYNGPGNPIWKLVEHRKRPDNGQYQVSLNQLRKIMLDVSECDKLPFRHQA